MVLSTQAIPSAKLSGLQAPSFQVDMKRVAAIILSGGRGTRLGPLTHTQCKPAISFGGKYRLIDIPLSNAINSGCLKIFVLTQFLSASLHKHIINTYQPASFAPGFIEILSVEQSPMSNSWFLGPADAVRKNVEYLADVPVDYFLILSGDQIYNFNFREMVQLIGNTNADLVVASLPVSEADAKRLGILKINEDGFITAFYEKPQEKDVLQLMRLPKSALVHMGFDHYDLPYLGSMGIYLFKKKALLDLLHKDLREDFGKHLIPTKVQEGSAAAYLYNGYWEDIGTVESFYNANIALTRSSPSFNFYDENNPLFSCKHFLPSAKITHSQIKESIICEGAIVEGGVICSSILGPRTVVKNGAVINASYIMGHDFYSPPVSDGRFPKYLQISENCVLDRVIIDKHAYLGKGVQLINKHKLSHYDGNNIFIRDGVIIVGNGASIPDEFVL